MDLFRNGFSRPAPEVGADDPRKTGLLRLWEIISEEYGILILTGLLSLLGMLPFIVAVSLACRTHSLLVMAAGGLLGGVIAAPALCGLTDTILRCLRDGSGRWWQRYGAAMRRNWKPCLLPGALFGLVFAVELFTLYHLPVMGGGLGMLLCELVSLVVCTALALYTLPQLTLLELPLRAILKNSALLSVRYFPKTLCAVLALFVYAGAMALFFPNTAIVALLTNLWLPLLCGLHIVYPSLDESFHLEEQFTNLTSHTI